MYRAVEVFLRLIVTKIKKKSVGGISQYSYLYRLLDSPYLPLLPLILGLCLSEFRKGRTQATTGQWKTITLLPQQAADWDGSVKGRVVSGNF